MELMRTIIRRARESGISAIIASDMAAIPLRPGDRPGGPHPTQVNVSNIEAVKFYAQFADVMVLARELNMEQVTEISRAIEAGDIRGPHGDRIRLEMFLPRCPLHGGERQMLHEPPRDEFQCQPRACNQICRRAYTVTDRETGEQLDIENKYIMSPKDLKTIHFLNKMVDAGVRVFKIEDAPADRNMSLKPWHVTPKPCRPLPTGRTPDMVPEWDRRLAKTFNRGFWDGYYMGQRLGEWSAKYGSSATRVKRYAAKTIRYFSKLGVGEFMMESGELKTGDEVVLTGPTTGALIFKVDELRYDLQPVDKVRKGDLFSMPVPEKVRPSDKLYLWEETGIK